MATKRLMGIDQIVSNSGKVYDIGTPPSSGKIRRLVGVDQVVNSDTGFTIDVDAEGYDAHAADGHSRSADYHFQVGGYGNSNWVANDRNMKIGYASGSTVQSAGTLRWNSFGIATASDGSQSINALGTRDLTTIKVDNAPTSRTYYSGEVDKISFSSGSRTQEADLRSKPGSGYGTCSDGNRAFFLGGTEMDYAYENGTIKMNSIHARLFSANTGASYWGSLNAIADPYYSGSGTSYRTTDQRAASNGFKAMTFHWCPDPFNQLNQCCALFSLSSNSSAYLRPNTSVGANAEQRQPVVSDGINAMRVGFNGFVKHSWDDTQAISYDYSSYSNGPHGQLVQSFSPRHAASSNGTEAMISGGTKESSVQSVEKKLFADNSNSVKHNLTNSLFFHSYQGHGYCSGS